MPQSICLMHGGHRLLSTAAAWALMYAAIACQPIHPGYFGTVRPAHDSNTLWINNTTEPEWIDPAKCSDSTGGTIIDNLFAGLVQSHPTDLHPMPDIAERWQVSPDGRTYTFYLRPTVWSDGTPLTAEDFAWSWRRVLDPNTASRYASMMHVLARGEAYNERALWFTTAAAATPLDANAIYQAVAAIAPVDKVQPSSAPPGVFVFVGGPEAEQNRWRDTLIRQFDHVVFDGALLHVAVADADMVGVHAVDRRTLRVELSHPTPYFLSLAAFHVFRPVPRHLLDRLAAQHVNTDLWTRPEYLVCNGPYVLGSWHFKHYFTYEKNPLYWDATHVRIPHVKVLEVDNVNTTLNLYRTGDIDWIGSSSALPSEFIGSMRAFRDTHVDAMLTVYFYWLNTKMPPLNDVRVRRALNLAIDRNALVTYVLRGGQIPTADLVPDGLAGYEGLHLPLFDPNQARQALADAGYPGGANMPTLTLTYNTSEGHKQLAEAVQAMWREHLGIDVQLENQEWKVFLQNTEERHFQIARMAWVADYPDANSFLSDVLSHRAGNNLSGWSDPEYDRLLEAANQTMDATVRLQLLRRAEAVAMAAVPLLPIYVYTRSYVRKPYLKGFWSNLLDQHPLKYMWIDPRWYAGMPLEELPDPTPGEEG